MRCRNGLPDKIFNGICHDILLPGEESLPVTLCWLLRVHSLTWKVLEELKKNLGTRLVVFNQGQFCKAQSYVSLS